MVLLRLLALFLLLGPAAAQDLYFDAGGVRIRYVDTGAGPAVVLVHGFTGTIERAWMNTGILQDLARDHRVVALDLRGHGHSDKPHDPRAYDEIGLDVIRLLDHLHIEKSHVVGYSLGGIIIAKLLTTHPERFASALLGGAAYRRSRSQRADEATEAAAREIEAGVYRALIVSTAPTDEPPPSEDAIRVHVNELNQLGCDIKSAEFHLYVAERLRRHGRCLGGWEEQLCAEPELCVHRTRTSVTVFGRCIPR